MPQIKPERTLWLLRPSELFDGSQKDLDVHFCKGEVHISALVVDAFRAQAFFLLQLQHALFDSAFGE